jgi:hypothetical protein
VKKLYFMLNGRGVRFDEKQAIEQLTAAVGDVLARRRTAAATPAISLS